MTMLFALIAMSALWGAAGFVLCSSRHRHRGIDTDDWDITDIVPGGGLVVVPDDARELTGVH